ncbi:NADPH-dependent 2,4-dienoyl-CoA reductase, sulfur reductase [Pseudobutyrivibrio sp. NOR37]|uniref:CoA-disulfide reductase n=1 Tax=Pseudobutyrivibrio xylanivorans TaxID=185007 RepID=A0A6M0LEC0_PSEXY|nr:MULTISPECIES: FAD-dependent oxidoreductase [Pseudobutyrivibrio]NEX00914.1 CoA-disulfide reductase [Pseudobutyrivibrio xylanivorans]SFR63664.1 NADPH-dependent 2,4-dienoyl-CoA reductase, sulfur reductase [Pseudobutyrivibrio sp. NOR37]
MGKTVIIGGVAAGASAAARLRRLKENEEIILFERGEYISYANCGLPYHVGNVIENRSDLLVTKKEMMESRYAIDVRINSEVTSINRDSKSVHVVTKDGQEYDESYDNLVIATGSSPVRPAISGIDSPKVKTLWTVPDTDEIKKYIKENSVKSATVIGGGFIGLEMAENIYGLGIDVTIVEASNQVMAPVDYEMALLLNENIRDNGVKLIVKDGVDSFEDTSEEIKVKLSSGKTVLSELVILSIGVKPNSKLAADAGLALNEKGGIIVDSHMRTEDESIYAAGDVVEVEDFIFKDKTMVPLAGPANKQGRIVADNIAGLDSTYTGTQGSSVVKVFDLNVATTGANEKALVRRGLVRDKDYTSVILTQNSHAGYYPGAKPMIIKLLFSIDGKKIYGGQIVGKDGVDKRIDTLGTAIRFGATVKDLTNLELAYAPPFTSGKDPINMAGFVAENVVNGLVKQAVWNEADTDKESVVLDVREQAELDVFAIDGAVNIPLGQLRKRINELDKNKKYIVLCAIGVRAYNAYRILAQNGFENIKLYPAGVRFYSSTHRNFEEVNDEFVCKY